MTVNKEETVKKQQYLQQQAKLLTNGLIDRRKFVMGALAAGIALPTALGMARSAGLRALEAACGRRRWPWASSTTSDLHGW